jgi:RHS repeat-associated protein
MINGEVGNLPAVEARFGYDGVAGMASPTIAEGRGVRFTGKERDAETGLDFSQARYLSSAQGRFTSPDPAGLLAAKPGNPQSWNLYAYVLNNPLIYIDPTGLDCVNATNNQGGFTVNHDTNAAACGDSGGTWVPGYVNESWVSWNKKTGQYQVASIDAAGSYDPNSGFSSTVDYATFKAGTKTDENGKCLSGCKGYGFSSASTDWLESQFVGKSGLSGYMQFFSGRDQKLSVFSQMAYGGLAFWKNNWAGPGGMGAPGGRGDWAASVHDFNFDQNGPIKIGMYFNPAISPATAKALIQSNNVLIRNAGGGPQAAKMGMFFGAVNAFQRYMQSWK